MQNQIRPGGGMRAAFQDEMESHADQNALQAASSQKALQQQASVLGSQGVAHQQQAQASPAGQPQPTAEPREVGTLTEELVKRPFQDIVTTLENSFDISALLGIKVEDTPAEKAKKQQIAQNWQKLTADDQRYVQQKYQEEMQKKQQLEKEAEQRKQQEAAAADDAITPPTSPKHGFEGLNAKKKASTFIQSTRKLDQGTVNAAG